MPGSETARPGARRGIAPHPAGAPLALIRIRGFRSARDVSLAPGPLTALLGAAGSGKSNLLVAVWKLLAPIAQALEPGDPTGGSGQPVMIDGPGSPPEAT